MTEHERFQGYSKAYTLNFTLWQKAKVMLLGEKVVTMDGPWQCIAYYYRDIWYIFDIRRI